jgi:hypothetical protein
MHESDFETHISTTPRPSHAHLQKPELWESWAYSLVAIACISLASLAGVSLLALGVAKISAIMPDLLALSAGTLLGKWFVLSSFFLFFFSSFLTKCITNFPDHIANFRDYITSSNSFLDKLHSNFRDLHHTFKHRLCTARFVPGDV